MASLKDIARAWIDEARDGIAWIVLWKSGRSWNAETFYPDVEDGLPIWHASSLGMLHKIAKEDIGAIAVNGYYSNLGGEEMTVATLATYLKWQYEECTGNRLINTSQF